MNGFDNSKYNIFKPQILIPSVATALGMAGLYIGHADIKVNFVHDYILGEWNKLLLLFSAFTIEPILKLFLPISIYLSATNSPTGIEDVSPGESIPNKFISPLI